MFTFVKIRNDPITLERAKEYPAFEIFDRSNLALLQLIKFIEKWGGGNIYPCIMPLPKGVKSKTGQAKAVIIQYINDPEAAKIIMMMGFAANIGQNNIVQ